jgi:alpha-glucoside transport system permease protein
LVRPWLFIGPALLILIVYLIYPVISTIITSFQDKAGEALSGWPTISGRLATRSFATRSSTTSCGCSWCRPPAPSRPDHRGAYRQDLVGHDRQEPDLPAARHLLRRRVGDLKFIYEYRGEGQTQIGILNAIVQWLGGAPQVWISTPFWNNFFLMVILIWIQTGFAMVILSAALRGISGRDHRGR